jgi:hypothetical protein
MSITDYRLMSESHTILPSVTATSEAEDVRRLHAQAIRKTSISFWWTWEKDDWEEETHRSSGASEMRLGKTRLKMEKAMR